MYEQMNFDKEGRNIQRKKKASLTNDASLPVRQFPVRRMQIDSYLSPCTKLKSKWIKDLTIKPDILKIVEKKVGNSLECIDIADNNEEYINS